MNIMIMTREEEIKNKAIDYSEIEENFLEFDDCGYVSDDKEFIKQAYIEGAKCADKTMIEKACEFLCKNMTDSVYLGANTLMSLHKADFIERFREAMEK